MMNGRDFYNMNSVKIKQASINIPTYKWGKEDIEPPLIREFTPRGQPIYPYTTQEIIAEEASLCQYKAVILENEYLKLIFLPGLNGRIYSAFDKVNKKELFYKNEVIKPALFGLRGAWAAVGVEYNFPNSHSTTTLEPINWEIKKYKDGSASFITGNVEWVSRMGWSMEVKLKPESCLIEMKSRLYNFTDFPQRFYYWLNAAVPSYPETQFIYPPSTQRLYAHPPMDISRLAYIDYPVHKGRDISLFKNVPQHFPIFAENMEEDFFGLYHHNLGSGLVHIADHSLVRGRKIWMFGNARDGRMFVDLLTDSGVDYCEIQTGPFTLQSDYRMLAPGKIHLQKDFWYPIAGLKGFNAASKKLAANIKIDGKKIKILINSTKRLEHLKVRIKIKQCVIAKKDILVTPLELKSVVFNLSRAIKERELEVDFLDESGNEILHYRNEQNEKSTQDKTISIDSKCEILDHTHLRGHYAEEQGYPEKAVEIYSKAGKNSLKAKVSKARLTATSGKFKEALIELEEALLIDRENPETLYLSGICLKNLGQYKKAEKRFSYLGDNEDWMEKTLFNLAEISVLQKKYTETSSRLKQLIEFYPMNSYALSLYALSLRKTGKTGEAQRVLNKAGKMFSFDSLVWGESFLLKKFQNKANAFKIISTKTSQQIIEILCRYMNINEFEEGLEIVNTYIKKRENNKSILPLIFYYRGYLGKKLGKEKENKKSFSVGKSSKIKWDFVFRLESEKVLNKALELNPDDHTALYHLGNLLAFKGRWDEAVSCWEKAKGNNLSCALRNQGLFYWKIKNEYKKAIRKYKEAVSVIPCGVKTIWEYDHLLEGKDYSEERIRSLRENDKIVQKDPRLLLRLASALIALDYCEEALGILKANKFSLCEGKVLPRFLYEEACCKLGDRYAAEKDVETALACYKMPLEYPENLGVGKPSRNMEAEWWYKAGMLLRETGNTKEAERYFRNGAKKGEGIDIEFFPLRNIIWEHEPDTIDIYYWINKIFQAFCLREIGKTIKEEEILNKINSFVNSKLAEGRGNESEVQFIKALALCGKGNKRKVAELLNQLPDNKIPYSRIQSFIKKHYQLHPNIYQIVTKTQKNC